MFDMLTACFLNKMVGWGRGRGWGLTQFTWGAVTAFTGCFEQIDQISMFEERTADNATDLRAVNQSENVN